MKVQYHILRSTLPILLVVLFAAVSMAQSGRGKSEDRDPPFGFSAMAGLTLSQIDGDNFSGYNNPGLYAGLRGITRITDRFQIHLELLYSQKGSRFESREGAEIGERDRHIKLDYAEVPILFVYRVTPEYSNTHFWVEAGISFARLLRSDVQDAENPSEQEFEFEAIEDEFGRNDVNIIAGVEVHPAPWLGIGLRGSWGVTRFYEDESDTVPPPNREFVSFLRNYSLSLYAVYNF